MKPVNLTITFTDDDGTTRPYSRDIEMSRTPELAREHILAHILFTELKVSVGAQAVPKHNAAARKWLDFPKSTSVEQLFDFDIRNSQAVWFELTRLVMRAEADLILAQAFKALEPPQEPPFDDTALNDLYNVHKRKMMLLDQSVQALIKAQDIVNRLLHESLGGDLVDISPGDWEKSQLTRRKVKKGLQAKRDADLISQPDFKAITEALEIPEKAHKGEIALTYRNRLAHHIRPSVDYPRFFSTLEPRNGDEVKDAQGNSLTIQSIGVNPSAQYRFEELHAAFSEYLDAVVAMLQKLSEIDILRR